LGRPDRPAHLLHAASSTHISARSPSARKPYGQQRGLLDDHLPRRYENRVQRPAGRGGALALSAYQALPTAAAAAPEFAGTCTVVRGELRYTAEPGAANELTISLVGKSLDLVLHDEAGPIKGPRKPHDDPGNVVPPNSMITKGIEVVTGDQDHTVRVDIGFFPPSALFGGLLAISVVSFLIPALFATLKFLLIFALIALAVVVTITLVGKSSR
jgi:hypothetical protein